MSRDGSEGAAEPLPQAPSSGPTGFELVVFDWDGTLVDSTHAITDAIRESAADLGLPVPSRERASHVIGLGLLDAIHHAVPEIRREQVPAFIERYREHFLRRDERLRAFEGIDALLAELDAAGVMLAVATGKSRAGLDRALLQTGWKARFLATRCADEGAPKPDPWMLEDILDELGVAAPRAVMVGDTTHDLQMARAAGTAAVAVTYGAHPAAELQACAPAACVQSVAELRAWLLPRLAANLAPPAPALAPAPAPAPDPAPPAPDPAPPAPDPAPPAPDPAPPAPGWRWQSVCASEALAEGGNGVRFEVPSPGGPPLPAFVVRFDGAPRAYLNRCSHVAVELDWQEGRFFDDSGLYLVCSTHGALYRAEDGACAGGPCRGRPLSALQACEAGGQVWVAIRTEQTR